MIDIDRFKSVNDNYGHPVGDQVIRSLAWLLRGRLRNTDLIGRYGGEEFIVALAGVDLGQAICLLERIREDFASCRTPTPEARCAPASVAASPRCPTTSTAAALIEAADAALLEAKRERPQPLVMAPGTPSRRSVARMCR
jgi:diguanylate cyclase (GGDEF)-like protein